MKKQSLLKRQAWLGGFALVCVALVVGCENNSTIPVGPELDNLEFSYGADGLSKGPGVCCPDGFFLVDAPGQTGRPVDGSKVDRNGDGKICGRIVAGWNPLIDNNAPFASGRACPL